MPAGVQRRRVSKIFQESRADSLKPRPDDVLNEEVRVPLTPLSDLDLMIENGWGEVPQNLIPEDWRTRKKMK